MEDAINNYDEKLLGQWLREQVKLGCNDVSYMLLKLAISSKRIHNFRIYQMLIKLGASPEGFDKPGQDSLLHLAAKNDNRRSERYSHGLAQIIYNLFKLNFKVTTVNDRNETPIHVAAKNNNFVVLKIYVDKYLQNIEEFCNIVDDDGLSLFHVICMISSSDKVATLLNRFPSIDINATTPSHSTFYPDYTAIQLAATFSNYKVVKLLIERGADITTVTNTGSTLLHLILTVKTLRVVIFETIETISLVGNNPNLITDFSFKLGDVFETHVSLINLLFDLGINIKTKNNEGHDALACTLFNGFSQFWCGDVLFATLTDRLEFGHWFETTGSSDLYKNVHEALNKHEINLLDILIKKLNQHNCKKSSVLALPTELASSILHRLLEQRLFNNLFINHLLDLGAQTNAVNETFSTALHMTINLKHINLFKILINRKKKLQAKLDHSSNIDAQDDLGNTALHCTKVEESTPRSLYSFERLIFIYNLLTFGANINVENEKGVTGFGVIRDFTLEAISLEGFDIVIKSVIHVFYEFSIGNILSANVRDDGNPGTLSAVNSFNIRQSLCIISKIWQTLVMLKKCKGCLEPEQEKLLLVVEEKVIVSKESRIIAEQWLKDADKEVNEMKKIMIGRYTCLHDLLIKNMNVVANFTENDELKKILESPDLCDQFPIYRYILRARFVEGLSRKNLLGDATDSLRNLIKRDIPLFCIDTILSYLSEKKLRDIIKANSIIEQKRSVNTII